MTLKGYLAYRFDSVNLSLSFALYRNKSDTHLRVKKGCFDLKFYLKTDNKLLACLKTRNILQDHVSSFRE